MQHSFPVLGKTVTFLKASLSLWGKPWHDVLHTKTIVETMPHRFAERNTS